MKIVTVSISDSDYEDLLTHYATADRMGRPLVAVIDIVDHAPNPTDDRPYSTEKCQDALQELKAT